MKQEILDRIKALGGNVDNVTGRSFAEDWQAISFDCVLYGDSFAENGWGVMEICKENEDLYYSDSNAFYNKILKRYYYPSEEDAFGQIFFRNNLFTPFREGTADYKEWNDFFTGNMVELCQIKELTANDKPDFVELFYSYGYPDHYYVAVDDPNPDNPTILGTDHEAFFAEIYTDETLEELLNSFLTQAEFVELIKEFIAEWEEETQSEN